MKIYGNQAIEINELRLRHTGINFNTNTKFQHVSPFSNYNSHEERRAATIEFGDVYEIDNLIGALQHFKGKAIIASGKWEVEKW